jgi:hypothetical protein
MTPRVYAPRLKKWHNKSKLYKVGLDLTRPFQTSASLLRDSAELTVEIDPQRIFDRLLRSSPKTNGQYELSARE